jgi:hypothetical protein
MDIEDGLLLMSTICAHAATFVGAAGAKPQVIGGL